MIRIIAVGGTFDKRYNPLDGSLVFGQSHLPVMLSDARLNQAATLEVVMQIDSLDMQDHHRQQVLEACKRATETRLIIIHGTDTMVQTAQLLGAAQLNKTIVLTGAMVPYAIEHSDASFNLGFAMACVQLNDPGVYIAMGGECFAAEQVRKNRQLGRFEALD